MELMNCHTRITSTNFLVVRELLESINLENNGIIMELQQHGIEMIQLAYIHVFYYVLISPQNL